MFYLENKPYFSYKILNENMNFYFCLYMVNIYCVSVIWYQEIVLLKSLECNEESKYKKNKLQIIVSVLNFFRSFNILDNTAIGEKKRKTLVLGNKDLAYEVCIGKRD